MTKMTNVKVLTALRSMVETSPVPVMDGFDNNAVLEKIDAMVASLQKKSSSGSRKKSAAQLENENLRSQIINLLSDGVARSVADIKSAMGMPEDTTPQRVTGIMRPALLDGSIQSKTIKGKKFYFVPELVGVEEAAE